MGSPCRRSPKATPISSGASRLLTVSSTSQVRRQPGLSRLPRYSNDRPRAMSAASSSTSARLKAENMVAYQPGNAANMAAPATISQTSLPSHSGPIVLIAALRSASSLPTALCSMPTPKSNPSRMKKPVHNTAMRMNQNGTSVLMATSILDGGHGRVRFGAGARGRERLSGVPEHQQQLNRGDHGVHQDECRQADRDPGGGQRRRDPVLGQHDALHDPRLPATLCEQPARGVHQERQHRGPGRQPQKPPG